jgi:L-malate glycosyltransferase
MKILLLADIGSSHTEKWALGLASKGIEVGLFSFNCPKNKWFEGVEHITIVFHPDDQLSGNKLTEKLGYFKFLPVLKAKLKQFQPDILHAHYASSYGLIGALSRFQPFVISVWGSDVFDFPKKGFIKKFLLKYALSKPVLVCSTSHCMKEEALLYTSKKIKVIPFGIDTLKFKRSENEIALKSQEKLVLGNIKSLEKIYGIDVLIHSFDQFVSKYPNLNVELLIVGDGTKRTEYEKLVASLGLTDKVVFTGRINHNEIPDYHRKIDIFMCLSSIENESFGVSLVEAMSSGSVVIASNVKGFSEVLDYGENYGYLVEKNNPSAVVKILDEILSDKNEALKKTIAARQRVLELYDWNDNLNAMITVYNELNH